MNALQYIDEGGINVTGAGIRLNTSIAKPRYPHTFWVLFWGLFINRISASLVWPFLTEYVKDTLGVGLTVAALLITVQSVSGLASTTVVSPLMDRVGRKNMMIFGLIASSAVLVAMGFARSFEAWVALMVAYGAVNQIYNIGSNAMVADLIEPHERAQAYALIRMISNLGIAIGPAAGGFMISAFSFGLTLVVTAFVNTALAVVSVLILPETIPQRQTRAEQKNDGGFRVVFRDRLFMTLCGLYILSLAAPTMIFSLLFTYVRSHFGIQADQYGWLVVTNALMVVVLQYSVTHITVRYRPFPVMALGALLYGLGAGSVALGSSFAAFLISMVILTVGEMIVNPTVTALAANIAPTNRRARYMGVVSMAYPLAAGFAPVIGGALGDYVSPQMTWIGALGMALIAVTGFVMLARRRLFEPQYAGSKPVVQEG